MKKYFRIQNHHIIKLLIFFSLTLHLSFIIPFEVHKLSVAGMMMNCVEAIWNPTTECVTISNLTPTCSPVVSSTYEWSDESGIWRTAPSSGQLCGCDVYEYLDVTPVCQVQGGNFILGGQQFNKCPGRCLSRTDFTFPQGSSNVVNYPACAQNLNCIEITPLQLMANGGSMTAYYRSNTPSGSVVTILRFTYNGLGLSCANINAQVVQRGKIYKHIFVRRTVSCGGGVTEVCEDAIDIPQMPDNCLLEAFINTVNLGAPCNSSGFSASTINLSTPSTYQWKYNGTNISQNYAPSLYCLDGRPSGIYCAAITDNLGCMTEVCRMHQSGCTLGVTISTSGNTLIASVTNCGPHVANMQWARWDGVSWANSGTNSNMLNTGGLPGDYRVQVTCGGCTAFGNIVIAAPLLGPLPVVLQKFEARSKPCGNPNLEWTTVSEVNSREFSIEKSVDGRNFTIIGTLKSKNVPSGADYFFEDQEAPLQQNSIIYYRLRHYDFDGTENIHKVIRHNYMCKSQQANIKVNPNPTSGVISIIAEGFSNEEIKLSIYAINGGLVKTFIMKNTGPLKIDLTPLPSGMYTIEAEDRYSKIHTTLSKVE